MPELTPESILSHYRILSKIGAGGMGEVYLAQDTSELGRTVALKILPAEVGQDRDRLQRFTQEARTVSNLNHPNILTVYEFAQTDAASFIATEYIDGVTLRQHLSSRRLKLVDVLEVTIQIVAALNAAHEAGITHRDLKPENIMVRKDHIVKVLDFGLAKLSEPAFASPATSGSEDATRMQVNTSPGIVMGTVSYMSPEQSVATGIDHRTDIWSLGVLLYEMLAGVVPFTAKDIHRQIIAIQEAEPAAISLHVQGVPERLEEIVAKCLAKDKNERYQTAKDLLIDLRNLRRKLDVDAEIERTVAPALWSATGGAAVDAQNAKMNVADTNTAQIRNTSSAEYVVSGIKQHKIAAVVVAGVILLSAIGVWAYLHSQRTDGAIQSIAVMPFVNESGNSDVEYLSDGMTETLISSLSQLPNLNVKARSLVFRYKGKDTNPQVVGRDLDVQAVLNGRVVQRGSDLILYLELVDARSGNLIWGDQYNRKQDDLVSLQSDIARDVSSQLKMKLSGAEQQQITRTYTGNAEAYRLYLRGRFYANKRTATDAQTAIDSFNQAIALDPNYALAYAGLGLSYSYLAIYGHTPSREVFPKALESAKKAMALDSTLAEPHLTIGLLTFLQNHDISAFERGTKRALELNPNSTDANRLNGLRLLFLGRFDESLASLRRALEIEPLSLPGNLNYAYCLFYAGRIDDGEAHVKKTIELSPDFWLSHYYLSSVYRFKKNFAGAAEELAIATDLRGETESARLIRESFKKGGWPETLRAITTADARLGFYPYDLATFYAELGDKDHAFAQLDRAIAENDQYIGFVKVDPFMKTLQDDPRYREILKKVGLPE